MTNAENELQPATMRFALASAAGGWYHNISGEVTSGLRTPAGNMSEEIFGSEARGFKMYKSATLIMALGCCVFCATSVPAQPLEDANQPQGTGVQKNWAG
jgi:hypothetical protein